jgi:TRAP-type C4-dicarboxylate transport system substrate-binding protein
MGLVFAGDQMWQRLSPQQKQAVRKQATQIYGRTRARRKPGPPS